VWTLGVGVFSAATGEAVREFAGWALLIGAMGIPAFVLLTKKAIILKYRFRPSFGSEARYSMSETGVTIHATSLQGNYPWSGYSRAVRFSDGMLLLQKEGMRWLPDAALLSGTGDDVLALVRAHLSTRLIG
jgi:hypothetical protein